VAAPDEADALYGLPLEQFVAERDALAKRLRAEGRRDEAAAVRELGKPTLAAWGVNQAVRARSREAGELWAAGDALAAAQEALLEGRGDARTLRDAARAEQAARRPLVEAARGLLTGRGRSLGESALERVDETLHAAAVDPAARADVAAGRATRELRHVGMGPLGLDVAPPPPAAGGRKATHERARPGEEDAATRRRSRRGEATTGEAPAGAAPAETA
jgi:hypothetical protein